MPEVHLPKVGEHTGKSVWHIGLEVLLISAGVFLGLMGEQWRETQHRRELAEQALRRFKTELTANRTAVESVLAYSISEIYNVQDQMNALRNGFTQAMYNTPPALDRNEEAFFASVLLYYGDMTIFEPRIVQLYD